MLTRRMATLILATIATTVFFSIGSVWADEGDAEPDVEPGVVRQDASASPAPDNAILAAETGLSVTQIDRAIAFQEAFVDYAEKLINRFPGQVSAVWMASPAGTEGPSTRGHVRFTGQVPAGITPMENVTFTGAGLISMREHKRRAEVAVQALTDLGHQDFATFYDPRDNVIRVELLLPEGAATPSKPDLIHAVQKRVGAEQSLSGRAAIVEAVDLALTVSTGSGPFITRQHSRGGNWLLKSGTRWCTSGWSVSGSDGDGIITAAHCDGLDQFEEPGEAPYGMTFIDEEEGSGGDVEYHTTEHVELAEFYSDETTIRDVTSIKTTATMVGGTVCVYGRSSNVRTCNHEVEAVNVSVKSGGCSCTVGSLARTDSTSTIGGDSGGGWSYNYAAWGVHHGVDVNDKGYFTPVEEAEAALNVTIKIQ